MNKTQKVKEHLQSGRGITSMEAFELYGATRLSAIIFNLRKVGMNILSIRKDCIDRFGETCNFVEYKLIEEEHNEVISSKI